EGSQKAPLVIPSSTMSTNDSPPDDVETLKRLLLASNAELAPARAEAARTEALVVHLRLMIEKLKRDLFGARNERKARLIVVQIVREKFTCRNCEKISQAPAPFAVLPRGLAGPSLLAMILFEKYGQHQPLNRQSERYAREGIDLSVS